MWVLIPPGRACLAVCGPLTSWLCFSFSISPFLFLNYIRNTQSDPSGPLLMDPRPDSNSESSRGLTLFPQNNRRAELVLIEVQPWLWKTRLAFGGGLEERNNGSSLQTSISYPYLGQEYHKDLINVLTSWVALCSLGNSQKWKLAAQNVAVLSVKPLGLNVGKLPKKCQ